MVMNSIVQTSTNLLPLQDGGKKRNSELATKVGCATPCISSFYRKNMQDRDCFRTFRISTYGRSILFNTPQHSSINPKRND